MNNSEKPMTPHQQWLNKVIEDVVDSDIPVVDCHHHFYKDRDNYFPHQPTYVAEHLAEDINDGHKVIATVGVECGYGYRSSGPESLRSLGETEFMLECTDDYKSHGTHTTAVCKGVIPFVDLRLGDAVEEVFLAQREMAGERLVGIRQLAAKKLAEKGLENTDSLLLDKNFQRGFSHLARHNLTFDVWILHPQIPEVFELAKKFPDTTIVLDHFGAPLGIGPYANHRDHVMATWRKDMQQLSELHNVVVKIGGLNMSINGYDWHLQPAPPTSDDLLAATRDYYLRTIDMFSPARCLFESNFPVDKLSVSYRTLWNAYKKIAREFTKAEAAAMLAGNAQRVYRL